MLSSLLSQTVILASNENQSLPAQYAKLPGKWKFVKVIQNGKDISSQFERFRINGKPITLIFEKEGNILYPAEALKSLKISSGSWSYRPSEKRNLLIVTRMVDGTAQESFRIVLVNDRSFIYEDTRAKAQFHFIRTK